MAKVDLDLALEAVSEDLDTMGDEIATVAGKVAKLQDGQDDLVDSVRAVDHKLDTLIDLIRTQVLPAVSEVDTLRRRVTDTEDRLARRLHVVGGE